jgi:hypothetical protein
LIWQGLLTDALDRALPDRQPQRLKTLGDHCDRGAQYVCILPAERLVKAGTRPSIVSRAASQGHTLAEIQQNYSRQLAEQTLIK